MFFEKGTSYELQQEWNKLIEGTNLNADWEQYKSERSEEFLKLRVLDLINLSKTKNISESLRVAILGVLQGELDKFDYNTLSNHVNYLIQKLDHSIILGNLIAKKSKIIYRLGEHNLEYRWQNKLYEFFTPNIFKKLSNTTFNISSAVLLVLGLTLINYYKSNFNSGYETLTELSLVGFMYLFHNYFCYENIEFFLKKQKKFTLEARIKEQDEKLKDIENSIERMNSILFAQNL